MDDYEVPRPLTDINDWKEQKRASSSSSHLYEEIPVDPELSNDNWKASKTRVAPSQKKRNVRTLLGIFIILLILLVILAAVIFILLFNEPKFNEDIQRAVSNFPQQKAVPPKKEIVHPDVCYDGNAMCDAWKEANYCNKKKRRMKQNCRKSCKLCDEKNHWDYGPCGYGWTQFQSHCYKTLSSGNSYENSTIACEKEGGTIASIHSDEENEFITDFLYLPGDVSHTYLGMKDGPNFTRWLDGTEFDYNFFKGVEPNNMGGTESCLSVWVTDDGPYWNDITCGRWFLNYVLCKKPVD